MSNKPTIEFNNIEVFKSNKTTWIGNKGTPLIGFKESVNHEFSLNEKYEWSIKNGKLVAKEK